jgi:hypothetical protein
MTSSLIDSGWVRALLGRLLPPQCLGTQEAVTLARGALWSHRVRSACGLTLTCHEGWVWLTREGDAEDHVLAAGHTVRLDGPGLVVVQALRPARFELARRPSGQDALPHPHGVATR